VTVETKILATALGVACVVVVGALMGFTVVIDRVVGLVAR
jgi:hypothetical protein